MLAIAGSLLGGWILSLFGFKGVVIAGMAQVFGVALNSTGYYFLFGALGAMRSITMVNGSIPRTRKNVQEQLDDIKENARKLRKETRK